jgi:hypothetical protein
MTLKTDFEDAAVEIFNTFESLIINGTYVQETSPAEYTPGGNPTVTRTEYAVRLIRDTRNITVTLAQDIPLDAEKYLLITKELAVTPKVKDKLIIDGRESAIIRSEADPGSIVTILYVV